MSEIKFLEKLTNHLEKLPGVGKKTAQRYAYYIADKMSKEDVENFAKDLIETNANNGLKSYIEALLCKEINKNFKYDFESANDYLKHYKEFLQQSHSDFNNYDKYTISLLK